MNGNNSINENNEVYTNFDEIPENQLVNYYGTEYRVHKIPNSDCVQLLDSNGDVALTCEYPFVLTPIQSANNVGSNNQPTTNVDFLKINSLNELEDKTPGTNYVVNTDVGRGNEDFILTYQDDGSYVLKSTTDGKEIPSSSVTDDKNIKVYNVNAYRTKADDYTTLSSETSDSTLTARLNGIGSADRPDIHDNYMHHTHVTQRTELSDLPLVETGGSDDRTYSSFEAAQKRYMTLTGASEAVAKKEVQNAIDSGSIKISNSGDYSYETSLTREDAIQKLTSTGQWLRKDAEIYVDSYASANNITYATAIKDKYFTGKYVDWYNELKGVDCKALANQVKLDVDNLKTEFENVKNQMEEWHGNAADKAKEAIACILGKFIVTMGNIENALEPACYAIQEIMICLEDLKTKDEELQAMLINLENLNNNKPAETCSEEVTEYVGTYSNGKPRYDTRIRYYPNPAFEKWKIDVQNLNEEITKKREELDLLIAKVEEYYQLIKNYQQVIKQFSSFVSSSGGNHYMISSADNVVNYHDEILYQFENYTKMPVITNLSDYEIGDLIKFDDGYGTLYKVVGYYIAS